VDLEVLLEPEDPGEVLEEPEEEPEEEVPEEEPEERAEAPLRLAPSPPPLLLLLPPLLLLLLLPVLELLLRELVELKEEDVPVERLESSMGGRICQAAAPGPQAVRRLP
jgi:hypothetical protein